MATGRAYPVGGLLAVGLPGPILDPGVRADLEDLRPGCVVLFRRNIGTPEVLRRLIADLHALPGSPLVAVDQEGGRVARLGPPFTVLPPAARIGATGDPDLAYRTGVALGCELRSVGFDIDFAPVLDIQTNPENTVIGDRAFGRDPQTVAAMGIALARGVAEAGVIACGKHFPGHGDTIEDSHFLRPVVGLRREELWERELVPFRAAIAARIPMLMTSHVVYPDLDPNQPATLSEPIVRGLLREELGFAGVIATDDMDMRAVAGHLDAGEAAVRAIAAGCDLVLTCQDLATARLARDSLAAAIGSGRLAEGAVDAALGRLEKLRAEVDPASEAELLLPSAEHAALVAEIERRATAGYWA